MGRDGGYDVRGWLATHASTVACTVVVGVVGQKISLPG